MPRKARNNRLGKRLLLAVATVLFGATVYTILIRQLLRRHLSSKLGWAWSITMILLSCRRFRPYSARIRSCSKLCKTGLQIHSPELLA